jgi:hypothetical protein
MLRLTLSSPHFSGALSTFLPPLLLYYITVFCLLFSFFWGAASLPRICAALSQGWLGEFHVMHGAHTYLVCRMSHKQVWAQWQQLWQWWQPSSCLPLARDSGCQRCDSDWCFTSAKCGSSISARFWIWSSGYLLLYHSHHLGSFLHCHFKVKTSRLHGVWMTVGRRLHFFIT